MYFFFFKQKTAYEMRISDWSSDVCSSDLLPAGPRQGQDRQRHQQQFGAQRHRSRPPAVAGTVQGFDFIEACVDLLELAADALDVRGDGGKIGRASCRARVCQYV